METLLQDVRHALVAMRRNKGFTTAGLLTLALGIGATTAVFSVVYGVLMRPLPYPEASRLVRLSEEHTGAISPLRAPMLSNLTYHAWSAAPRTVEQFAAYRFSQITVTRNGESTRIAGADVTPSFFSLLGETPARGRFFLAEEGVESNDASAVLSDRGWRERFGADPAIVGRGVVIDGKPFTIVGVARPGFAFPTRDVLLWTPRAVRLPSPGAVAGRPGGFVSVIYVLARLRPGVTTAQAEVEGTAAARTTIRPMAANLLFGIGGPPVVARARRGRRDDIEREAGTRRAGRRRRLRPADRVRERGQPVAFAWRRETARADRAGGDRRQSRAAGATALDRERGLVVDRRPPRARARVSPRGHRTRRGRPRFSAARRRPHRLRVPSRSPRRRRW